MLGDNECDEETAYFLKYGKNKPYKRTCKLVPPTEDNEEAYREYQEANFNEYFDWAGTYRYALWK